MKPLRAIATVTDDS